MDSSGVRESREVATMNFTLVTNSQWGKLVAGGYLLVIVSAVIYEHKLNKAPEVVQVNNPSVSYVAVAPSGVCIQSLPVQVLNGTGVMYTCNTGMWRAAQYRDVERAAKASISQLPGLTDPTMTTSHGTALVISTQTDAIDLPAPPVPQQTWKHAEFFPGGEGSGSRLVVDGKTVETRSSDLRHVWYAPGWDTKKVDKTLEILHKSMKEPGSVSMPVEWIVEPEEER